MWLPFALFILAGVVAADNDNAWRTGSEYHYLVRSRTLTGLEKSSNQYSGIVIKALLTVQPVDAQTLRAKVSKPQYAHVHKDLPDGWDAQISDSLLQLQDLPISGRPFEIKTKHGVIRDLIVSKETPTWEVNVLKSIVSQLQVDTQGENALQSRSSQVPEGEEPYAMFKAMEDSVGGRCQVLYDISPLPEYVLQNKPELVPKPELKGEGHHIDIVKTKNYNRCEQRMAYHFGIPEEAKWEPGSNENGKFLSKSTTSRIIISGNLKHFTIQSSVTTNKMFISPRLYDQQNGAVLSRMNLTLANVDKISNPLPAPNNPESVGNLVYTYNNPFSDIEQRKPGRPTHSQSSRQNQGSVSSSEEVQANGGKRQKNTGSDTSGGSSSSISSSEEDTFWQPKPKLDEAPESPLLPFFIGYKGKAIGKSNKIDPVKATKELVHQIANELDDPSSIPTQDTLEKFTILATLMRTMNRKQITEAAEEMQLSPNQLKANDKSQSKRQNAWAVFRDAVTEAGTGPALMIIKDWIENNKIHKSEATQMVSVLPKKTRTPTAEYVQAFFELATNPAVTSDRHLQASAILAFTNLVRESQISGKSIHNRYPVHSFGRFSPKRHQAVTEEYIPYLARQLKSAIKDGDSPRIQAFIFALGNLGHPKILSVFEPYLEGKEPVTTFQRTVMVASMVKLVQLNPKLARSVLYKIYLNANEAHEVRCTAVFLLMIANPPLNMLERMAEFTNHDTSKHVSSAVKSNIEGIAKLERPEMQDMANKARAVKGLLTRQEFGSQYSKGLITDAVLGNKNLAYQMAFNYIGSDDSVIPKAWYMGLEKSYSDFQTPPTEILSMVSSMKALMELQSREKADRLQGIKSATEKIAEALKIKAEEPTQVEGNLLFQSKYSSRFIAFDNHTLGMIPEMAKKCVESLRNGGYANMNSLMSYDVTLSFPTETGFPFVYALKVPILHKASGTAKTQVTEESHFIAESEFRLVYSMKVQGRVGFVTPFEHQSFVSGVDMNIQAYAPAKIQANVNPMKKSVEFKLWPITGEKNARLMHYSVVPYTSKHDILNLQPVLSDKNTHKVLSGKVETISDSYPSRDVKVFKLDTEIDDGIDERYQQTDSKGLFDQLLFPWPQRSDYLKVDVSMNLEQEQEEPVVFSAAFDSMQEESESHNPQEWQLKAKAVEPSNKQPNSEARRKQFLKEAAKGLSSGRSNVVDLRLEIPGRYRNRNSLTLAWATSNIDKKARTLLYWHSDLPNQEINYEVCAAGQMTSTSNSRLNYENAMKGKPAAELSVDVRYGNTCFDDGQINVSGKLKQSEDFREQIQRSNTVKKCLEQMKQGNKALRSCQKASSIAKTLNEMDISVELHSKPMQMLANRAIDTFKVVAPGNVNIDATDPKNADKDSIDIKVKLSRDLSKANVKVHTSVMDVEMADIKVSDLGMENTEMVSNNDNMDIRSLDDDNNRPTCVLDATQAETFDERSYPLNLGKCWHVAMTTYPKRNPDQSNEALRIPEAERVSIVTRENEDGQKEVKIILGEKEIRLSSSGSQRQATVNGQKVRYSQQTSYQERDEGKVSFEIFELRDGSIRLISDKYDVDVIFDGKRIQIQASDKYRSSIRGLCGNFDGEAQNDFTSPKDCILKKPEEFLASYALTKEECEGPSQENARRIEKFTCTRRTNRLSNVISDYESGRFNGKNRKWGYHSEDEQNGKRCNSYRTKVSTVNDKICFTMRPVPSCAPGCAATETKSKNYQFHCMENGQAAQEMKKRVEKGANPDLSQKAPSLTQPIEVPLGCRA